MREGSSANTAASYRAAMRYWAAWFELRYGRRFALPLPETAVVQFVVDHARRQTEQGLTSEMPAALDQELVRLKVKGRLGPPGLNTVLQRVSVLSKAHDTLGLPNPCRAQGLRAARPHPPRACPARRPRASRPLTREPLQALLDTCDDSLRGLRDRALLLFAWASGGRRRSKSCAPPSRTRRAARTVFFICCATPRPTRRAPPGPRTPSRSWERRRGPGLAGCQRHRARPAVPPDPARRCAGRATGRRRRARYRAPALRAGGPGQLFRAQPALGLHHRGRSPASAIGRCHGHDGPRQRGHGHGYYRARGGDLKAARLFDLAATEQPAARGTPAMPAPPDSATTWRAPARS